MSTIRTTGTLTEAQITLLQTAIAATQQATVAAQAWFDLPTVPAMPTSLADRAQAMAEAIANEREWQQAQAAAQATLDHAWAADAQATYDLAQALLATPGQYLWGEHLVISGKRNLGDDGPDWVQPALGSILVYKILPGGRQDLITQWHDRPAR